MTLQLNFETLAKNPNLAESFDVYMCNGFSLPSFAIKFLKEEANLYEARNDDIYVISYPKTGTTWLQKIVYLIQKKQFQGVSNVQLNEEFPYIEHARTNYSAVKEMISPRLLKTHLPYSLLPIDIQQKKCKILYITRNPRDVAVSYYHFARMLTETQYKGDFNQFFERFIQDRATYSPFLQHNLEFWNHRNDPNILFLFYEDLKQDFAGSISQIAGFLGSSLSDDEVKSVMQQCNFESMSKSESAVMPTDSVVDKNSRFFRKGEIGDWKNYFSPEMIERLNQKIDESLKDCGLTYTYEI